MTRYKVNPGHPKARERARLRFADHYRVMETKFDGIQVQIEDRDPRMAADLANAARELIDRIALSYVRGSQERLHQTLLGSINEKQGYLNALADSLSRVQQETGVYDTREQGRYIGSMVSHKSVELAGDRARLEMYRKIGYTNRDTIANITARIAGLETELADLTGRTSGGGFDIARFNAGSGLVATLQQQYENTKNQLSYEIEKANHLRAVLGGEVSVIIPFEEAQPPVTKHRPKRVTLVLSAVVLTLLFGMLFVLIWDSLRREIQDAPDHAGV
jgi:tyrosine-protein kinase Etk/Wzc